jgi:hypothetical protein
MGTDPNAPDNRWLRTAMEQQMPVIYFLGTSPDRYLPILPTFVTGWHPDLGHYQTIEGADVGDIAICASLCS